MFIKLLKSFMKTVQVFVVCRSLHFVVILWLCPCSFGVVIYGCGGFVCGYVVAA